MGAVWDGWVWYMGAVWEQYWSGGMGSGVKRYGGMVADDALSDIFFSKSKLMARFQSHQESVSTKKRTSSGTSRSPMTPSVSCFFVEMDTSVRSNLRHKFESNPLVLRLLFSGWR